MISGEPVAGEVVHYLDFTADVFDIITVNKLTRGNRLTSELLLGFFVSHQVGNTKLTTAELAAKDVSRPDILQGTAEHTTDRGSGGGGEAVVGGGGRRVVVVVG